MTEAITFCDIDGCLNDGKHIGFDLNALAKVRQRIQALENQGVILSLCTGRRNPMPRLWPKRWTCTRPLFVNTEQWCLTRKQARPFPC